MSADFIGLTVLVKLKSPPVTLQGLVANVQGQRLFLKDGKKSDDIPGRHSFAEIP